MAPKHLSVVIPAYNEERRIVPTLKKISGYLDYKKIRHDICVVDDGSTDGTALAVRRLKNTKIKILRNAHNKGKGFCVRKGMLAATGDYALFTDADLSTPITELEKLLKHIPDYDIIIGSRRKEDSKIKEKQNFLRVLAGNIFPVIAGIILDTGIDDTQCGFKVFNLEKSRKVFEKQTIGGFCFDAEILYIARRAEIRIKEVGVSWNNNPETKLRLLKDSWNMFWDLFRIRLNGIRGHYD